MGVSAQRVQRWLGQGFWPAVVALGLALAALAAPMAAQGLEPQGWGLKDQDGHGWSLTLLEQADPAYESGLRLRLTDRSGTHQLDHSRPLQIHDGLGATWQLTNRSDELVPAGVTVLPTGSAQFELAGLEPRPRAEVPLALEVPLTSGQSAQLMAGAAVVAALHGA
jgi:hypothetical protein